MTQCVALTCGDVAIDGGHLGQSEHVQALTVTIAHVPSAPAGQTITRSTGISLVTHAHTRAAVAVTGIAAFCLFIYVGCVVCRRVGKPSHILGTQTI